PGIPAADGPGQDRRAVRARHRRGRRHLARDLLPRPPARAVPDRPPWPRHRRGLKRAGRTCSTVDRTRTWAGRGWIPDRNSKVRHDPWPVRRRRGGQHRDRPGSGPPPGPLPAGRWRRPAPLSPAPAGRGCRRGSRLVYGAPDTPYAEVARVSDERDYARRFGVELEEVEGD